MAEPKPIAVPFNDLPEQVRARLMAIFTATPRDPRVLAFEVKTVVRGFKYVARVVAAVVAAICVYQVLTRAFTYNVGSSEEYQILAAALIVLVASQIRITIEKRWPPPPYRAGLWALPGALVETDGGLLRIWSLSTLGKPTIVTVMRNGRYSHSRFGFTEKLLFSFGSKEAVDEAATRILEARARVAELIERRDLAALAQLDPFAECTLSGTWGQPGTLPVQGPTVALAPKNPFLLWGVPVLFAVAVTGSLMLYVNHHLGR